MSDKFKIIVLTISARWIERKNELYHFDTWNAAIEKAAEQVGGGLNAEAILKLKVASK